MDWRLHSALPGIVWPALPSTQAASVLAILYQLERSQWLRPEALREMQRRQLAVLLAHAYLTVPYYREKFGADFDPQSAASPAAFAALPLLRRRDLLDGYESLKSEALPAGHGGVGELRTSGSSGSPVRVLASGLAGALWKALTLRDHAWHGRDLGRKLAVIRRTPSSRSDNWGPATHGIARTGPCVTQDVNAGVTAHLDWLVSERPSYLLTYPSLLAELAKAALRRGAALVGLREARTLGEALGPDVRALCREAWGVQLTDVYSAEEVGYIGLQCPENEHYHVQSEGVLLEVLDERGKPCEPGQIGRVVVTTLHNFAMPLIRYELGDYAKVGEPCPCGRGLPVLQSIAGRVNNMLVTADGGRYWPVFGMRAAQDFARIRQHQFVQTRFDLVEARLVVDTPLSPDQEEKLRRHMEQGVPAGMRVKIVYRDAIPRTAGGKFQDFVCEVRAA
jgi:phenylacetate-CoA ligase